MKRWRLRYYALMVILVAGMYFLLTPVIAHVPTFGEGGKSPETATSVENPTKSRVLYGQLSGADVQYYSFKMEKGERIVLGLIVPAGKEGQIYTPDLILMGPGLANEGEVPETAEVPEGYGAKVFSGKIPESATYEGFTPSAFYSLARADLQAPESGTYYAAVSSIEGGGNYGVILGYREIFSLIEWLLIPLNQIRTYRWEGQSLPFIFFPLGVTLATGILAISLKKEAAAGFNPARWAGIFAGLFFLGTGLSFIFQMLVSLSRSSYSPEVIITVFLALASIGLGITALILSLKNEGYGIKSTRKQFYFFGLGLAGLLLWAGWFIGPILAFEAAVLPWRRKR
ncbi:hypothetical protein EO98_09460 [Methanosarcina sp. 2.H.T.1A.6]|uniref:hypothetical protein n=1 Tax=unclassified Methanosarcina TaxID=2644672 RepID=UPI000621D984|nr:MULTISPECIES: hypothetical protein [unclassified Methanosarcina]KKG14187.1 hypothetical protein EO94_15850 [Methanosarcina sp. 2.H.T.1A.3]KKG15319.1 hypothetical protein EO97_04465 [Methanosarcina sp. 2.H.T.1A.15]KKG19677.1 hypothetical protein EO98_09460 [Methanosarcina sp. 2.H.T.1A.6]KKG24066.1 hypothetical protein EO96_10970 [Methanosarcina sp. 2.H.T.1A.8]